MGGANSRNQEKGAILQAWVREIVKKGNIWHVFITICLLRMFESHCINIFELEPWFRSIEKYDVHRKMFWVWCSYIYSHFHVKKSTVSVEKEVVFFSSKNPRKGVILQT